MKQFKLTIILLMVLFASALAKAHVYDPISTEGRLWEIVYNDGSVATYTIQGDSIINKVAYKKVMATDSYIFGDNKWHYFASVRDSQRKTNILYSANVNFPIECSIDFDISREVVLYDFGLGGMEHNSRFCDKFIYCNYAWNNLLRNHERRIITFWTDNSNYPDDELSIIDMFEAVEGIGKVGPNGNPFFPYYWTNGSLVECRDGNEVLYKVGDYFYIEADSTGDVNGDERVDVEDVNAAISFILGESKSEWDDVSADLNHDYKIDVADVNAIINIILSN
ncbi:MAG: dockerin type I repeat-containing protein [Muribaculaceae bacterium]|nr:dockerin type I repeat-containing protein [Muribaculaceae bacterium]